MTRSPCEWSSVAGANTGYYTEGIISSLYQLTSLVYPVEIQSNVLRPGVYRIISPYGPGTEFYSSYVNDNGFIWAGDGRNTDIVIDATDPDYVYVSGDFYPGTDDGNGANGQGVLHVFSFVDAYLASGNPLDLIKSSAPELFGTLVDGIITIPASALAANFDDTLTPYYYANGAEIKIALPGYVISDYSSSFVYNGCFIDVAGNSYLQGTVMLGEDVASAKYVIASSGDDVQAIIDAVNDGSIEGTEIRESGDVSVALSESGNYNFIIITYDAAGNMQGSSATSFTFTSGGSSWEAVAYGTYQQNYKPNFVVDENDQAVGNPFGTGSYQTTLYVDPSNASRYKLDPWIADGVSLVFTMSNDGIISFPQTDTGAIVEGYGTVYAVNANEVYPGYGPFSAYTQDGVFIFGVMFGINVDGKMEWLGGASEIFTPTGEAGVPPMKGFGLQRSVKNFGKKPFRNSKVKLNNAMKVKKFVKKTVDMK